MRCVVQRVSSAAVHVDGLAVGSIDQGLLVFVGFGRDDDETVIEPMLNKLLKLRIFADEEGKMKHNVVDANGKMLLVSQFTLYGSLKKGHRPSFTEACPPEQAQSLYDALLIRAETMYPGMIQSGTFGADMKVSLVNDGPVTLSLEL
ncbi:MAG: D-aminoacyl-tRNA deacylase [Bacteroidota bacterium]|nr:D-aminoacyl-tRNA deacylase [Bacteroidota bacterium]MEC7405070.1 D-aminoacyl-tRNA deacylase [Bacteroidota bacterium]MEC8033133.1 D-aminoacyl-tRNA deacylase [Bacteroidota bacterium]MEC9222002.1 D-aminoacyl-tRNA deacylase [Bacteroidota bacterium]